MTCTLHIDWFITWMSEIMIRICKKVSRYDEYNTYQHKIYPCLQDMVENIELVRGKMLLFFECLYVVELARLCYENIMLLQHEGHAEPKHDTCADTTKIFTPPACKPCITACADTNNNGNVVKF